MANSPLEPDGRPRDLDVVWEERRQRLRAAQTALDAMLNPDSHAKQEVLRRRRNIFARIPEQKPDGGETLQVVEFRLAFECYAVELRCVREISPLRQLRPLKNTPAFVLGLISIRGQILSVVDLRKIFDLPERGLTDLNKVLILQTANMEVGVLADAILSVRSVAGEDITPPLPTLTGARAAYARGVAPGPVVILDVPKILSDPQILVNED